MIEGTIETGGYFLLFLTEGIVEITLSRESALLRRGCEANIGALDLELDLSPAVIALDDRVKLYKLS